MLAVFDQSHPKTKKLARTLSLELFRPLKGEKLNRKYILQSISGRDFEYLPNWGTD